jgi:hypothetical protein
LGISAFDAILSFGGQVAFSAKHSAGTRMQRVANFLRYTLGVSVFFSFAMYRMNLA